MKETDYGGIFFCFCFSLRPPTSFTVSIFMASSLKRPLPKTEEQEHKKVKIGAAHSLKFDAEHRIKLNPADCDLDFNVEGNGLQGHALYESGFAYCWSGARANVGITAGKYCFGCKIISKQPVEMEDTPPDQQHVCRVGISRGDNTVGNLGESEQSFGFGGTGKFSNARKFSDYGTKFGVGDTIICAVDLENKPLAVIGFSKNGKWLGTAKQFDAGPRGLGVLNSPMRKLQWESALFPHVLLKNVVVEMQFSVEDGLVPEEGYKPWSSAVEDGNAITGPTFSNSRDCEVIMMVGLPASGKTTWAEKWVKEHPEKRYVLLGTNLALDQMKVPGLLRKQNYGERFDRLMDRATGIFNTLLSRAAKTPRNYILDQTNVYKSARKRKLKAFANCRKIAVVAFPTPDELKFRGEKRFKEMGKEVPAEAINEMLANYVLPMSKDMPGADEFFDEVMFPELNRGESERYLDEMKRALGSASKSNSKKDFSPYSRESSVQSFTSPVSHNRGAISATGHWQNSHSPLMPPNYDHPSPQQVNSAYSSPGLYEKPELSSGGYRSGLRDSSLSISREASHGKYSNYGRSSLPGDDADPYGSYGGNDPYNKPNSHSSSSIPGRDINPNRSYDGNNPYNSSNFESKPNFGSRSLIPGGNVVPFRSFDGNDPYGRSNLERPSPNFESSRISFPYGSPNHRDPRLPRADMQSLREPIYDPHGPFSASYGSAYETPPPRPSYGNLSSPPPRPSYGNLATPPPRPLFGEYSSTERRLSGGYPPLGPRY